MGNNKYSIDEYNQMVGRIKNGTATEEDKVAIQELVLNATIEVEEILKEDEKES